MMSNIDYKGVSEFVKEHYPNMVSAKIKVAEDVMNNTFLFDMDHDLERTTEPVHFDGAIDWEYILNGDKEFAYQLTRHRYFIDLGEAYHLTGKSEYVKLIVDIMMDFIDRAPYREGSLAWRTLETGLRGEYWTRAIDMIKDTEFFTDDVKKKYLESLEMHAKVLLEKKIDHHRLSNWGVLQDHGLFDIALVLGNKEYIDIALNRLYEEARLQTMADGVHWEVSTTYHNEVLGCFIDTIIRANEQDIVLSPEFMENVLKMARVNMYWVKPNHKGPLFGDSDVNDLRGIMSVSAYLFNDKGLRYVAGDVFDYDNAWRLGLDAVTKYENMAKEEPKDKSIALNDSGHYIMRTGYGEKDNYLAFHNCNTGGGHAHEDKLSFELNVKGEDVLVDTGRYSYVWNAERKELKSYRAHNTTSVDNSHFIKALGWDYIGTIAPSIRENMVTTSEYDFVRGTHIGYINSWKGAITTSRSILWIKPDIYIVIDEFFGKGSHKYSEYYNFAPASNVSVDGNTIYSINNDVKTSINVLGGAKLTREKGVYSDHYNAIEEIERVVATSKGKGNHHMMSVIVADTDANKNVEIEEVDVQDAYNNIMKDAAAVKIKTNGVTYTVIATFREHIKLLLADGKPATGKVTLYKNDEYHIIKW